MIAILVTMLGSGCGFFFRFGNAEDDAIVFQNGELMSSEAQTLANVDRACGTAMQTLGYDAVQAERHEEHIDWRARTASGDLVEIRLHAKGPERTDLRIRIGVLGDEARSRLLLEEIHQSL